jgi:prepilin peptidase CpaA
MPDEFQVLTFVPGYLLISIMLIATFTDIVSHRIPNVLIVPGLSIALLIGAYTAGTSGLLMCLAGLGVGLAMLLPMYATGMMGAGDVKLLGVAGAFLGPQGALIAGLTTFIAGAILGVLWIAWRFARPSIEYYVGRLMDARGSLIKAGTASETPHKSDSFAYAPAIAIGAAFAIWQQGSSFPLVLG